MRVWSFIVVGASLTAWPCTGRADDGGAGSGWALASAGAIDVTGFVVGGTLLARGRGVPMTDNAGWLTMQSSFVLAPFVAHGVNREWSRGALFAILPLAALAVTTALFQVDPKTVESGTLEQQRWMWAMFGAGLLTSTVGVVDALFAPARAAAIVIRPAVAQGQVGVQIGGTL
jgi:hypothetical protein